MRATIRDVAKKAGYSISTVSLVLNNKNVSISQSTRDKVLAAVKALDYRPNQLAVSMVTKKTNVIGLIIPDNSNMFFADLSKAIEVAAHKAGYNLIYGNSSNDSGHDIEYMRMFTDRQVDGIIFAKSASICAEDDIRAMQFIRESKIPFVSVDRELRGNNIRSVLLDNRRGGYLATRHLLELGHRKIGCVTGPLDLMSSHERLEGYRDALAEYGVPYKEELIAEGDFQMAGSEKPVLQLLRQNVTGIFSFNDMMAYSIYQVMARRSLRIPQDISLVGFDDLWLSDFLQPPLTTVHQPVEEIGRKAVAALVSAMNGEDAGQQNSVLMPTLHVRASTCAISR